MTSFKLSPYVSFIENRLFPGLIQHAVSHRLSGEVLEPGKRVRSFLLTVQTGNRISLSEENLLSLGADGYQLKELIEKEFLIPDGYDPLASFLRQYVTQPIQNPALSYRSPGGEVKLVRLTMVQHVFSPRKNELPDIIEETMPSQAAKIFEMADGSHTLQEIYRTSSEGMDILADAPFREALEYLVTQERQLIKFTPQREDLENPYKPVNIVPRNLYHSSRWNQQTKGSSEPVIDFHLNGIEDAGWEFDLIEPTVNHSFRFPNESLGGFDYGSRFAVSTLRPEIVPSLSRSGRFEVLEIGGGTGSFARSFLEQAQKLSEGVLSGSEVNYHILDLSPALMDSQRKLLSPLLPASRYFHQDATKFSIPNQRFDLIIANEVIADFPMALVERRFSDNGGSDRGAASSDHPPEWQGPGAHYLEKYGLATHDAPDSFLVSAGAFEFIERGFEHLAPGGSLLVSEYGTAEQYPRQAFQLNHEEFSIHFGHLSVCAARIGFICRLLTLKEFLAFDERVLVLNGRQEHLLTLNHVLQKQGMSLPYAVISRKEFEERCQPTVEQIGLKGFSFSPLSKGYHFGPKIDDFMILIMTKPSD
jgi:hypothetical protein